MGAFTPFKKHANRFNYIPRYYDPAKEAREQRRAEMHGERLDQNRDDVEYRPGQFIRTSRDARSARLKRERDNSGMSRKVKMWLMVGALCLVAYMGSLLYNKLVAMFVPNGNTPSQIESVEEDTFDPYAPITVVPNDYVEE